jgi:hypothetical protein
MWGLAPYALVLLYVRFPQIRIFRREFLERIYTAALPTGRIEVSIQLSFGDIEHRLDVQLIADVPHNGIV